MTRSAAADANVALSSSSVATRSVAAVKKKPTKEDHMTTEFIPCLPKPAPRVDGFWASQPVEKRWIPELQKLDQTAVKSPHPELAPYWGDVDDISSVYLFDRPSTNYVPIKLPGDVRFTDTQNVSSLFNKMYVPYLIKYMIFFIK